MATNTRPTPEEIEEMTQLIQNNAKLRESLNKLDEEMASIVEEIDSMNSAKKLLIEKLEDLIVEKGQKMVKIKEMDLDLTSINQEIEIFNKSSSSQTMADNMKEKLFARLKAFNEKFKIKAIENFIDEVSATPKHAKHSGADRNSDVGGGNYVDILEQLLADMNP